MGIKFSFSIPLKRIQEYAKKGVGLAPLPEYIIKRGPYIHNDMKIVVLYEFDNANLAEAREVIAKHVQAFQGIPGFSLHSHILEEGEGLRGCRMNPENGGMTKRFTPDSQTL